MDKEKRFVCHTRIHVRDNLFGSAMVVTSEQFDDSAIVLFEKVSKDIENYINTISRDEEPTPKRIKEYVEQLKREGWSNKRIISHFAKFGITVDIPEKILEDKKLPNGQKNIRRQLMEKEYVECWNCGGTGYTHHDCGEDTCAYLDPEDNVPCDVCNGAGGWLQEYPKLTEVSNSSQQ